MSATMSVVSVRAMRVWGDLGCAGTLKTLHRSQLVASRIAHGKRERERERERESERERERERES